MITKKQTYQNWYLRRNEITGFFQKQGDEIKIHIVGLKNEDVTQGVALRLTKIVKKIEEEFKTLQIQLDECKGDGEEEVKKRRDLWSEELEISFEELDIDKLDIKRKDNSFGQKYDYSDLIELICSE